MTATATEQSIDLDRRTFAEAFARVAAVVKGHKSKPVLEHVKLEVSDGALTLLATDEQTAIRYRLDADVSGVWSVLLPAARVTAILREIQSESLRLTVDESSATITSGGSVFKLTVMSGEDFPPVDAELSDHRLGMDGGAFRKMAQRTAFACDVDSTRYALGGVLVTVGEDVDLAMVATDSRRMAVVSGYSFEAIGDWITAEHPGGLVVPQKAIQQIASAADGVETVTLSATKNAIVAHCGHVAIWSRLVDGRFPRWQDVVPDDYEHEILILAGVLRQAVRQAMIMTNQESAGVDFVFSRGTLTLQSQAADVGESKIEVPISADADMTVTFDPRYVDDFLKVLPPEDTVCVRLIDGDSAVVLVCDGCRYVVMPMSRDR